MWFQKISIPPPQRELEIPEGGGGSKAQEIPERRGVVSEITFPDSQVRCCDNTGRNSLLIYFADIVHRVNITSGI